MNKLSLRRLCTVLIAVSLLVASCNISLFRGRSGEPKQVKRAKKEQEDRQEKIKRDYYKSIDRSRKRTYEIQTPDVRARMEKNRKNIESRDKIKKKRNRTSGKKAGRKYN